MNGLMVAFAFALPYHVLRTATAAGVRVHVLGSGASRGLRASRCCASYRRSAILWNGPQDPEVLLAEIGEIVRRRRIDVIFPSDDVSTRLLAGIRDRLPVPCTPLPDLATFDLLNDKWNFTRFALAHGVRVPEVWRYDAVAQLRRDLSCGALTLPITVKPTNCSGSRGVIHIRSAAELDQLDTVDYAPVLVQRHIVGETVGISVICRDGAVLAHAAQRRDERRFQLFASPDLVANVTRLAAAARLHGPANFDAVVDAASGLAYIVECNPRLWFTIYMSMIVGLNFFDHLLPRAATGGAAVAALDHGEIRFGIETILSAPWAATAADWKLLAYNFGDPLVYLMLRLGILADRDVAVAAEQMQVYPTPSLRPAEPEAAPFRASA